MSDLVITAQMKGAGAGTTPVPVLNACTAFEKVLTNALNGCIILVR